MANKKKKLKKVIKKQICFADDVIMQGYEENIKADKLNHSTYIARTTFQLAGYYLTKQNKKAALFLENSQTGLVSSSL